MTPIVLITIYNRIQNYFTGIREKEGKLAGFLGTLIVHLVAAIIFMLFKIGDLQQKSAELFTVDFEPIDITRQESERNSERVNLPTPSSPSSLEAIFRGDDEMLNIARNLAARTEQTISREDYIDMVKEEMIKSGLLGTDNYIDEWKRLSASTEDAIAVETEKKEVREEKADDKLRESQEMAANYKGPTRIYYELEGRNHIYLPVPIYMCEGSGKVALSISVNQKGLVEDAKVISAESTTSDQCLIETAISTALASKFRPDINSPKVQKGTITYHFVAQ